MIKKTLLVWTIAMSGVAGEAQAQRCTGSPVAVQILGSGGPRVNSVRASSAYLLWVGNQARVLVDAGGGAFLRFGQSEAKLSDLSMVAISHLHPDHVSDLPALLWLSHLSRPTVLPIRGPSGNQSAPDFSEFLTRLFDQKVGAFPLLAPVLGAPQGKSGGGARLDIGVVDVTRDAATTVFNQDGLIVTAIGIPHGDVPTLAYRVQVGDVSVVFSSDQTGTDPRFIDFAKGAGLLLMHLTIGAGETNALHGPPAVVGRVAAAAGVGRLIVSHIGQFDLDAAVAELRKFYPGPLTVGTDLACVPVN